MILLEIRDRYRHTLSSCEVATLACVNMMRNLGAMGQYLSGQSLKLPFRPAVSIISVSRILRYAYASKKEPLRQEGSGCPPSSEPTVLAVSLPILVISLEHGLLPSCCTGRKVLG